MKKICILIFVPVFLCQSLFCYPDLEYSSSALAPPSFVQPLAKEDDGDKINLITDDSILAHLGKGLYTQFFVPKSAQKQGFWQYTLDLTYAERDTLHESIFPCYSEDKNPSDVIIAFNDETPVLLITKGIPSEEIEEFCRQEIELLAVASRKDFEELWHKFKKLFSPEQIGWFGYLLDIDTKDLNKRVCAEFAGTNRTSGITLPWLYETDEIEGLASPIYSFRRIYSPATIISDIFRKGINPKKGSKILVLGSGTGVDAITAAERGAGEIIAADIDPLAVACTQYNVSRSPHKATISVHEGDLFDISSRPKNEKYSSIYFDPPIRHVPRKHIPSTAIHDPGMKLLKRLLLEAGDHLEEGGTLEITYEEDPVFLELVYQMGWEPVIISGVNSWREETEETATDYSRFILMPQKNKEERKTELRTIQNLFHIMAEFIKITEDAINGKEFNEDRFRKLFSIITFIYEHSADEIKKGLNNFSINLLAKTAYTLLKLPEVGGKPQLKYPAADPRVNEIYSEYFDENGNHVQVINMPAVTALKDLRSYLTGNIFNPDKEEELRNCLNAIRVLIPGRFTPLESPVHGRGSSKVNARGLKPRASFFVRKVETFLTGFTLPEFAQIIKELKWWIDNIGNPSLQKMFSEIYSEIKGSVSIEFPEAIVPGSFPDRYMPVVDGWLGELLKRYGRIDTFVELGVFYLPIEHLKLVRRLKELNPSVVSLGLDILPLEDMGYALVDLKYGLTLLFDKDVRLICIASNEEKGIIIPDNPKAAELLEKYASAVSAISSVSEILTKLEDDLVILKIDIERDTYDILGHDTQNTHIAQGSFDTLRNLKDIDIIFASNTLGYYRETGNMDFVAREIKKAESALREGGLFIDVNSTGRGTTSISAVHRKIKNVLTPEEIIFSFYKYKNFTSIKIEEFTDHLNKFLEGRMLASLKQPDTPDFTALNSRFQRDTEITRPDADPKKIIRLYCGFLIRQGIDAYLDDTGFVMHIRLNKNDPCISQAEIRQSI